MKDDGRWFKPLGTATTDGWPVAVDASEPGWEHTALRVATLAAGDRRELNCGSWEYVVVPLSGSVRVQVRSADGAAHDIELAGRRSVFAGVTDVAYVPREAHLVLTGPARGTSKVALCGAHATKREHPVAFRHVAATDVPVELRGAGQASREVHNFAIPAVLDADSIIACEVITPAGNWSSYPPHKHDEERAGQETQLEEIYYFELQPEAGSGAPEGAEPVGYQRVYGTQDHPIEVLAEVRTGDVVLVPHGWHGPAAAPPGYDLYYLNVMAGPGPSRAWLICDDPTHSWVRDTWSGQDIDPRLPLGGNA
ncbi:5-deoxy-glucuronate isomerase [Leekyejoonella antrihumi]|uniref:5-deoxy-glucuronate isomerase n=1 Tax=Leekyejoonella antrihumi TaxID=1660198 RepID=A0A563E7J7_9MICO|nr:5-deoxy-glucuronate isomerase [Leekyejoonella antrihumi]TWP38279.1 5-deoxy-glucuronate isomerase [Leekyejoonella antrihumi]